MQTFVGVFHLLDNKSLPYRHLSGIHDVVIHLCCELAELTEVGVCFPLPETQYRTPGLTQHGQTWSPTRPRSAPNFLLLPHDLLCPTHQFTLRVKTDLTEKSPLTLETGISLLFLENPEFAGPFLLQ